MTEPNYEGQSAIDELAIRSSQFGLRHSTFVSPADSFHRDLPKDLKADYILANPPFNMSDWGGDRLREDARWKFGVPSAGNATHACRSIRNSTFGLRNSPRLAPTGMAGFVFANGSMSSNQSGEGEIRKAIIEADLVDCMVALPGQLFYSMKISEDVSQYAAELARHRRRRGVEKRDGRKVPRVR